MPVSCCSPHLNVHWHESEKEPSLIGRILRRVQTLWRGRWYRYLDRIIEIPSLAVLPAQVPVHDVYLVTAQGAPQWLGFTCPCKCSRRLLLPLARSRSPHWTVTIENGLLSVWPSVDAVQCGAHFFIRDGSIDWV